MLAPFVMFVPLEWFCYYLSIYKDHNPDDRRYYGGLVEY
jgi:fructoselysine 6-phosphate deglycase